MGISYISLTRFSTDDIVKPLLPNFEKTLGQILAEEKKNQRP
jgi:hypothetical protein